jgi:hypothetical protein
MLLPEMVVAGPSVRIWEFVKNGGEHFSIKNLGFHICNIAFGMVI